MSRNPIPDDALDDRLGFIGTSGSGKTYNAGGAVERLLRRKARVVIVDPLGVWWGLRALADGKTPSPFNVVIFGGPHGDLPLNERAGALIGETAVTMAESCIVELSQLGTKTAERQFMTEFLETIFRKAAGEPFHLIVDEADLFAPQKPPKGDETLLNRMEQIVRRGRVKGFIPWVISQRPAVINKNVLSQVDGLIAFKLTSTQDRDAIDAWIEGQADKEQGKAIKDSLPAMQVGHGVVWVPGRGILETVSFPAKSTFDSSATPKRGEKRHEAELKPLNIEALKGRLASVAKEAEANDPKRLRQRVAELERALAKGSADPVKAKADRDAAYLSGVEAGRRDGLKEAVAHMLAQQRVAIDEAAPLFEQIRQSAATAQKILARSLDIGRVPPTSPAPIAQRRERPVPSREAAGSTPAGRTNVCSGALPGPQQRILDGLAELRALGVDRAPRVLAAFLAGYGHLNSKGFTNGLGALSSAGLISYPERGKVALTDDGMRAAEFTEAPLTSEALQRRIASLLGGAEGRIIRALVERYPQAVPREEIAAAAGYGHLNSKGFTNALGRLHTLGFAGYPARGSVVATDLLFL